MNNKNRYLKHVGFSLNLAALGLFFPGIWLPIFSLDMTMMANLGTSVLTAPLVAKEISILGTVDELWQDKRLLVATLIFLFSVMIPMIKTLLVNLAYFSKNQLKQQRLLTFVSNIGKWSMADVFVVAIFLTILSTDNANTSSTQEVNLGLFKMSFELSSQTLSNAGPGFWFFTAYCLLSMSGTQMFLKYAKN